MAKKAPKYRAGQYVKFVKGYDNKSDKHDSIDEALKGEVLNRFLVHSSDNNGIGVCFCTTDEQCKENEHNEDNYDWFVYNSAVVPFAKKSVVIIKNETKRDNKEASGV